MYQSKSELTCTNCGDIHFIDDLITSNIMTREAVEENGVDLLVTSGVTKIKDDSEFIPSPEYMIENVFPSAPIGYFQKEWKCGINIEVKTHDNGLNYTKTVVFNWKFVDQKIDSLQCEK